MSHFRYLHFALVLVVGFCHSVLAQDDPAPPDLSPKAKLLWDVLFDKPQDYKFAGGVISKLWDNSLYLQGDSPIRELSNHPKYIDRQAYVRKWINGRTTNQEKYLAYRARGVELRLFTYFENEWAKYQQQLKLQANRKPIGQQEAEVMARNQMLQENPALNPSMSTWQPSDQLNYKTKLNRILYTHETDQRKSARHQQPSNEWIRKTTDRFYQQLAPFILDILKAMTKKESELPGYVEKYFGFEAREVRWYVIPENYEYSHGNESNIPELKYEDIANQSSATIEVKNTTGEKGSVLHLVIRRPTGAYKVVLLNHFTLLEAAQNGFNNEDILVRFELLEIQDPTIYLKDAEFLSMMQLAAHIHECSSVVENGLAIKEFKKNRLFLFLTSLGLLPPLLLVSVLEDLMMPTCYD